MACSSNSSISYSTSVIGYSDRFSDLIDFGKDKALKELIPQHKVSFRIGSGLSRGQLKSLANRLKDWNEFLDRELWDKRYDMDKMSELKYIARSLFNRNITLFIRAKLKKLEINSNSLNRALTRMEELLIRIHSFQTPKIASPEKAYELSQANSSKLVRTLNRSKSETDLQEALKEPFSTKIETVKTQSTFAHTMTDTSQQSLALELLSRRFTLITDEFDKDWIRTLLQQFSTLKTVDEIVAVAAKLNLTQCSALLQNGFRESGSVWMLPYFIVSISFENFKEVMVSLEEKEIHFLNRCLKKQSSTAKDWMNKKFNHLRTEFVDFCNEKEEEINAFTALFRDHIEQVEPSDVNAIINRRHDVMHDRRSMNRVRVLILGVFHNPETHKVLWEIQEKYEELDARLTNSKECINNAKANIYAIIERNIFEQNYVEDDEESYLILGCWNIIYPADYHEVGLLQNLTDEEFEKLSPPDVYKMAYENLKKIEIPDIKSWKQLQIYGRTMLTTYLKQPEISQRMKA